MIQENEYLNLIKAYNEMKASEVLYRKLLAEITPKVDKVIYLGEPHIISTNYEFIKTKNGQIVFRKRNTIANKKKQ